MGIQQNLKSILKVRKLGLQKFHGNKVVSFSRYGNQLPEKKGEYDHGTHGVIEYFILMIVTVPNFNNTKFKTRMYCI